MHNSKKLHERIFTLERQNKQLRQKLSKYKRYVSKSENIIMDNYDRFVKKDCLVEKYAKYSLCDECGKGELNKIKILDFSFVVCPICKYRKKIN